MCVVRVRSTTTRTPREHAAPTDSLPRHPARFVRDVQLSNYGNNDGCSPTRADQERVGRSAQTPADAISDERA